MDDIKNTFKYWVKIIIWRSLVASISLKELGSKLANALFEFVIAVVLVLGVGLSGNIPNFGFNVVFVLSVFIIFVILRFSFNMLYIPAKIYTDQGGFIENPFEITPIGSDQSASDQKWATIKVKNKSSFSDIVNCVLVLNKIVNVDTNQSIAIEHQYLLWSGREQNAKQKGNEPALIAAVQTRWCDVATVEPRKSVAEYTIWFGNGLEEFKIRPGKYRLTIIAHGKWKDHPISYPYHVDLGFDFEPEVKLRVERVEEIKMEK